MGQRAVYKDKNGATFSAPVVLHDGAWVMVTSEGFAPINFHFDDDFAGRLSFVEYRDEPDARLHMEPKQPGQSSFGQLQAAAAKERLRNEAERASRRAEVLNAMNEPDARKIQQARDANNLLATRYQKHREVIPPPIPPKEDMAEQHRVPRNWRKKSDSA